VAPPGDRNGIVRKGTPYASVVCRSAPRTEPSRPLDSWGKDGSGQAACLTRQPCSAILIPSWASVLHISSAVLKRGGATPDRFLISRKRQEFMTPRPSSVFAAHSRISSIACLASGMTGALEGVTKGPTMAAKRLGRDIVVATCPRLVLSAVFVGLTVSIVSADPVLLTFDTLPPAGMSRPIPDGYGGLSWTNFRIITSSPFSDWGYRPGTVSPPNVAFNGFGDPASFQATSPFDFNSGFITAAFRRDLQVQIDGFARGELKYSTSLVVGPFTPHFATFGFRDVDQVRFAAFGGTNPGISGDGTHFALDDLAFGLGAVAPIPEPGTLWLMAVGLGTVGVRVRRTARRTRPSALRPGNA
jgi:hypothetical protein